MTIPEKLRQQKARRMTELGRLARQRYLDAGGDPLRSANENYLTEEERQEYLELGRQVFDDEYINNYLQKKRQKNQQSQLSINADTHR